MSVDLPFLMVLVGAYVTCGHMAAVLPCLAQICDTSAISSSIAPAHCASTGIDNVRVGMVTAAVELVAEVPRFDRKGVGGQLRLGER